MIAPVTYWSYHNNFGHSVCGTEPCTFEEERTKFLKSCFSHVNIRDVCYL